MLRTTKLLQSLAVSASNGCRQVKQPPQLGRNIWGYVAIAFNNVDNDRLQKVGPDRLCAEWILKNSGAIRTLGNPARLMNDYNALPAENVKFQVKVVDASDATIMKIGLEHFKNCRHIDTVILHNCKYMEEDSLEGLAHLWKTLTDLQVSGCQNINDDGLKPIGNLKNLKNLKIFNMNYVKDLNAVVSELQAQLPGCSIEAEP